MTKTQLAEIELLGRKAFLDGKPGAPMADETIYEMVKDLPVGGGAAKIFKAYRQGWEAESMKAAFAALEV